MSDELEVLEEWAGALLAKLEPGERRKLLGQVARDLRRNQQSRIEAQKAPDGTAYAPRKRQRAGLQGRRWGLWSGGEDCAGASVGAGARWG